MAGKTDINDFAEKISPFLKSKMEIIKKQKGEESAGYKALYLQYVKQDIENTKEAEANIRHWEADLNIREMNDDSTISHGVERLYRQSMVIEPTMLCAAHCRYCLRGNYGIFTLSEKELRHIAKYCGSNALCDDVSEVLITGGDPFLIPQRLRFLIESLIEFAPNIKRIRIGSRLPLQDPDRIDNNIYEIFKRHGNKVRFEMATQINHVEELFPEVIDKLINIKKLGVLIYSQNVLLKGVNDNLEALVDLYGTMRDLGIEAHYLFHSVPMKGMHHLRTSVRQGLELVKNLSNSGEVSGRTKPMFALMTDIGKITLYEGSIISENENDELLIQSSYRFQDRIKWNPDWKLPATASIDNNGYLRVRYLDGNCKKT